MQEKSARNAQVRLENSDFNKKNRIQRLKYVSCINEKMISLNISINHLTLYTCIYIK